MKDGRTEPVVRSHLYTAICTQQLLLEQILTCSQDRPVLQIPGILLFLKIQITSVI
jgi:hypothetical protein